MCSFKVEKKKKINKKHYSVRIDSEDPKIRLKAIVFYNVRKVGVQKIA